VSRRSWIGFVLFFGAFTLYLTVHVFVSTYRMASSVEPTRCTPQSYEHGVWTNYAGEVVGLAVTEDSDIRGANGC
jgi:hypothetical protein